VADLGAAAAFTFQTGRGVGLYIATSTAYGRALSLADRLSPAVQSISLPRLKILDPPPN